MKTLLEFRIERLEAENDCPCCGSYRAEFLRNPAFFPDSEADDYLFSDGDQVSARYECGSEFVVTDQDEIRARQACAQPSVDAADELQEQADENCNEAEDALETAIACRECGCTDDRACLTDGVPCHWVEPDLCSACSQVSA